jgi:predicted ABC-type ATPase
MYIYILTTTRAEVNVSNTFESIKVDDLIENIFILTKYIIAHRKRKSKFRKILKRGYNLSMELSVKENEIKQIADTFAKIHKDEIAKEVTRTDIFLPEENPVSVFMAGSPGAGKTESSKNLIQKFSKKDGQILRIDPDELRIRIPGYTGDNSYLFHGAVSILVSKIHDLALKNKQSFVFDGTFSKINIARENIQRSLKRGRFVQIFYVYQDAIQAWDFVQKRELLEGRRIEKEHFITQYFAAREVVNLLKKEFGNQIKVDLLVKNIDGSDRYYKENIDIIDNYVEEGYTIETLQNMLK